MDTQTLREVEAQINCGYSINDFADDPLGGKFSIHDRRKYMR